MNTRYCSAKASTEIFARSTFCVRAKINSTSSGPSNPSSATTRASSSRGASSEASQAAKSACGSGPAPALSPAGPITMKFQWISCASSAADYTDSGAGAQNLGNARLCLGHVQGLGLSDGGPGPREACQRVAGKRGNNLCHGLHVSYAAAAQQG